MSINLMVASGNIGKDCVQRFTPNGKCIATFSLPVKSGYGDYEKVSWVQCKIFGKRAEVLPGYLTKGTKVTVTGEFCLEEWEKDGVKHTMPTLTVVELDFAGQKKTNQDQKVGEDDLDQNIPF